MAVELAKRVEILAGLLEKVAMDELAVVEEVVGMALAGRLSALMMSAACSMC